MSLLREPNAEPLPGYRLIEPLGSGGFGEVWKCEAPGGLFKAIKFVYGNLNSLDVDGVRAEQELKALNRVKEVRHPFVLSMDRIEVVDGELVIVMELADKSLHDRFEECLSAGLVGIPARHAAALHPRRGRSPRPHEREAQPAAPRHQAAQPVPGQRPRQGGRLRPGQEPRAVAACPASWAASRRCTPPRRPSAARSADHSDQYSLAIVYQELLTGQRPFNGKNAAQLAQQHMNEEPELRSLPGGGAARRRPGPWPRTRPSAFPTAWPSSAPCTRPRAAVRRQAHRWKRIRTAIGRKTMLDTLEDLPLETVRRKTEPLLGRPSTNADVRPSAAVGRRACRSWA